VKKEKKEKGTILMVTLVPIMQRKGKGKGVFELSSSDLRSSKVKGKKKKKKRTVSFISVL